MREENPPRPTNSADPALPQPTTPPQRPPTAEVAWNQSEMGAPIHPMLTIDRQRRAAFVCLPLPMREGERGAGGVRSLTKPFLVMVASGMRQLIPLELTAIPLETEPCFADPESRWDVRRLEAFLRGTETPPRLDEVFDEIHGVVSKYLDLGDPVESKIIALYTMMSYCFPLFDGGLPFIKLQSAGPGSGKTKLCSIIAHLGFNSVLTSSVSPAAIYRVGSSRCLLLLDEAEDLKTSMATLLNASYRKGSSVLRSGPRGRLERFALWGPRIISAIQPLPDSVASRCILIRMSPARDSSKGRLSVTETSEPWNEIRARIYSAVLSRWQEIDVAAIEQKETLLTNRAAEIWTPILAIAAALEPQKQGLVKELVDYASRSATPTTVAPSFTLQERMVIKALAHVVQATTATEFSPSEILATVAAQNPGAEPMTVNGLGVHLKNLGAYTARVHRLEGNRYQISRTRVDELAGAIR